METKESPEEPTITQESLTQETPIDNPVQENHQNDPKTDLEEDNEIFELTDDLLGDVNAGMEEKLNLTAGERDELDEFGGEMDEMFEKVMKQLNSGMDDPQNLDQNMGNMMGNMTDLLQQMMKEEGKEGESEINPDGSKARSKKGMGAGGGEPDLDGMADKLLRQLMDKSILYEPFTEARKEMGTYVETKGETLDPEEKTRCFKQYLQ